MVIWIVNQYINTPENPGSSRHYEFARVLADQGHQVVLIGAKRELSKGLFYSETREGFRIVWINIHKYYGKSIKRVFNMLLYSILVFCAYFLKKPYAYERPQIIIGSSVHLFAAYAAYLLSRAYSVPFVFEVRDLWPQTLIDMGAISENSIIANFFSSIEHRLYRKSTFILTLFPFAHEYITGKYGIKKEKIRWLSNGVNTKQFPVIVSSSNHNFRITYIGSHGRANDLSNIVDAAAIIQMKGIDKIQFHFIGNGPLKNKLIDYVNEKNIGNIKFSDSVPKCDVYQVAAITDAFIISVMDLPLYYYGISMNKIFEYMAMGRPTIIASNAKNNPVLDAAAGVSVKPDDPVALANAAIKLSQLSVEKLDRMGQNGRDWVEKYYEFNVLGSRLASWLAIFSPKEIR